MLAVFVVLPQRVLYLRRVAGDKLGDARLPASTRCAPARQHTFWQADGYGLAWVGGVRSAAFAHTGARKHLVGQFRQFFVFRCRDAVRIHPRQVTAQGGGGGFSFACAVGAA